MDRTDHQGTNNVQIVSTMASRRSSSRRSTAPAFPSLPVGVQNGLKCLISDNQKTVAEMLDSDKSASSQENLAEQCALVMKQQQLSAAQFLARFFQADMLADHVTSYLNNKSAKGTSAHLAERIANEWAKNKALVLSSDRKRKSEPDEEEEGEISTVAKAKKKKASTKKKNVFCFEASLDNGIKASSEHATSRQAAAAAWEFCDEQQLEMPSSDWHTETRHGSQECADVMVSKLDLDPEEDFIKYMMSRCSEKGKVKLTDNDNGYISIARDGDE